MQINRDVPSPYSLQIEPTEGCNLACSFCGLQSLRDNGADAALDVHGKNSAPYKFMTLETHERIVSEVARLGWNPRIEWAMHGEPGMNKQLTDMVKQAREYNPKAYLMLTTNGGGLVKDTCAKIAALFDAGLNTLAIDNYKHAPHIMTRILEQLDEDSLGDVRVWHRYTYPAQAEGNPHHRHTGKKLVLIHDISENDTGNHTLTNQGGNSFAPLKQPLDKRCAKPFRELSVRWDGAVAICCDDWKGAYKIGNVNETPLDALWYGPRFESARRRLYANNRDFGPGAPCTGCDVTTYRNGLLPDKLGKSTMLAESPESKKHIAAALAGRVFSIKLG